MSAAAQVRVPAIFEAVDRLTAPMRNMSNGAMTLAQRLQYTGQVATRTFDKLTPSISAASKQLFDFVSSAAIAGAIVGGVAFSTKSIMDYENAVASFRVIVSDLSDKDFAKFKTEIKSVATETNASSIQVAQSFEKIAGLNATFAETSVGLGQVSKAAIILSKASREDLGVSATNLVGIMNQFNLSAAQADRTINVLAAGTAVGASSIAQTSEAFKNFGATAAAFNIPLENSVALVQTLGKFSIFGAEAGTKLRGSIGKLEEAGFGYVNGVFDINAALEQASVKMNSMATEQQRNAFITKTFGLENKTAGLILLNNIDTYKQFTAGVTGTSEATKAAELNSNTLSNRLIELQNKFVTLITTSNTASGGLNVFKTAVVFVTENLSKILGLLAIYIGAMVVLKAVTIAGAIATGLYNIAMGINGAVTGVANVAIGQNILAMRAYIIASKAKTVWTWLNNTSLAALLGTTLTATAAQWGLNAAMLANPIGLVVLAIFALIAAVVAIIYYYDEFGAALSFLLGPLGMVINLIMSVKRNWDNIVAAFENEGILAGLKMIGATILDMILYPLQQVLEIAAKLPGFLGGNLAADAAGNIENMRRNMGVSTADPSLGAFKVEGDPANPGQPVPVADARSAESEMQRQMLESVTTNNNNSTSTKIIDFKNMPSWVKITDDGMPSLGSSYSF